MPWITISSGATGSGNGTLVYNDQSNLGSARTGTLTIAGQTFTINQAGSSGGGGSCSVSLSLARKLMIAGASTKSVVVTAPAGCPWTAGSSASWLTPSPKDGTGNGTVSFASAANPSATTRSATLTIGGQTVAITQASNAGNGCTYALGTDTQASYPDNAMIAHAGGTGSVPVTSPGGCGWTASSNAAWITITVGMSGSGNGTVQYNVAANAGSPRTGTLTIAGLTFTFQQN